MLFRHFKFAYNKGLTQVQYKQPIVAQLLIYTFGSYAPDIYSDKYGLFFDLRSDRPLKKEYNNGSIVIRKNNKKYSLKLLRMFAKKEVKEIADFPF